MIDDEFGSFEPSFPGAYAEATVEPNRSYTIAPGMFRSTSARRVRAVVTWLSADNVPMWSEIWPWVDVPADEWVSLGEPRHAVAQGYQVRFDIEPEIVGAVHYIDDAGLFQE